MTTISRENAEPQLQLLLDFYGIETEDFDEYNDEDDKMKYITKQACKRMLRYILKGLVEIKEEDDGVIVTQYLKLGGDEPLVYGVVTGRAKMEMRHAKENDYSGKIYYLLGSLCKKGFRVIASLKGIDSTVAECIGAIFLMA